jgi:hypothetical protein
VPTFEIWDTHPPATLSGFSGRNGIALPLPLDLPYINEMKQHVLGKNNINPTLSLPHLKST